ncbi:MAG: toxin-antitoxin system HicB family antitoxin [Acidobacteriia bacterium]|nr:toxin-antitoxin system HicB family antitoxin [Terriglobia bacterium]
MGEAYPLPRIGAVMVPFDKVTRESIEPKKPFSGTFSLRLTPRMHRQLALEARRQGKSLNAYLVERLQPKTLRAV